MLYIINMIKKYEKYLKLISEHLLKKYFEQQKDYIHCKPGCSHCCESGQYPFSEIEFRYAMIGFEKLSEEEKNIVRKKVKKVKDEKANSNKEEFMYECPFLIDKKCSIYEYRGIICRTHGLMFFTTDENELEKKKVPHCIYIGLNYSNVFDKNKKILSPELWEKSEIKKEPLAYNLGLKHLLNNELTKELKLEFGEEKALIDWFKDIFEVN